MKKNVKTKTPKYILFDKWEFFRIDGVIHLLHKLIWKHQGNINFM